jgi:predicted ribosomally synthesized peptide with SipW-like signal peptide
MIGSRPPTGPRTSIRVRAALAGGLVLGLAAGMTVASWTDAEFAGRTFTASTFGIETSINGAAYSATASPSVSVSGLYPSATVTTGNAYVSLKVRTLSTSIAGNVSLAAVANAGTGLAPVLRYRIVATASACVSGVFTAGATYVAGTFSTYQPVASALSATPARPVAAAGGTEQAYCIELSIPPGSAQGTYAGTSAVLTLNVTGTSA